MAYSVSRFNCARRCASPSSTILNNAHHIYTSLSDSLATIFTPGYFPSAFGFDGAPLPEANDILTIKGSDGVSNAIITNNLTPTIAQIPSENPFNQSLNTTDTVNFNKVKFAGTGFEPQDFLTDYSERVIDITFTTSPYSAPPVITFTVVKIGKFVCLAQAEQINGTFDSANHFEADLSSYSWMLPTGVGPYSFGWGVENSNNANLLILLDGATKILKIYNNTVTPFGDFVTPGSIVIPRICYTYNSF